jgi:UDP-glucose 4-epimerase
MPTVVTRFFNTVGPRQTGEYGMVIPRFVGQALRGEPLTVYADGQQRRCFVHVRDVVRAVIDLMETDRANGEVFNIGSTEEITMLALAERVLAMTGSASKIEFIPYAEAYGPDFEDLGRRVPDVSKLSALLQWKPQADLDEILNSVIDSMRVPA